MAVTPEIQGLDSGVGLVPQGRLGSGIANVFDTNVAQNLARLGARMENLDKLKLATAAKLASAKEKETVAKGLKLTPYEAVAATGKAAFNSGQKVISKLFDKGYSEYVTKKSAGDIEGANQIPPLYKYYQEGVNNKTAAIDNDAEKFFTGGFGQFVKANSVKEQYLGDNRPDDYDKYMSYNEMEARNKAYEDDIADYDLDKVGAWAMDASGKNTYEKTAAAGNSFGMSGISALFKLQLKSDGTPVENAQLQVDYDNAKKLYQSDPYIRKQLRRFGEVMEGQGRLSKEYAAATDDEEKKQILKDYYTSGERQYMDYTLASRGSKDIRKNLETNYHRAAAKAKAEKTVIEDFTSSYDNYETTGRAVAESISDPTKTSGRQFDYKFGNIPSYNFANKPQIFTTGVEVVPMGDPRILVDLGVIVPVGTTGTKKRKYTLTSNVKFGGAHHVQDVVVNQTGNRPIPGTNYLMPTGMLLPTGISALADDETKSGYIIETLGEAMRNVPQAKIDALTAAGKYSLYEIERALNLPYFVDELKVPNFNNFIDTNFKNTPRPTRKLKTSNR